MEGKNNPFKRNRDVDISRGKKPQKPIFQLNYKIGIIPCWVVIKNKLNNRYGAAISVLSTYRVLKKWGLFVFSFFTMRKLKPKEGK